MRLVRFGAETSQVGADVRAALSSWGTSDTVLGGVALLGVTPLGCSRPVEAVIVAPRGVVVVVGVDLPNPAVRLEAPLSGQWKADGWPLVREDGAVNPAGEALRAAKAVAAALAARALAPIPVSTVVAVGPYVGQVVQSTQDLHQGVRVLYPEPKPMLAAVRELAVAERPCSVEQARKLLHGLVGDQVPMLIGEVAAEGFADAVTADLATASTTLIPKITDRTSLAGRAGSVRHWLHDRRWNSRRWRSGRRGRPRWLALAAFGVLAVMLITGLAVALAFSSGGTPATAAGRPPTPGLTVAGVRFEPKGSQQGTDCVSVAYGDVRVWLSKNPCTSVFRSLYQTGAGGRPAAVAVAVVSFADPATATAFGTETNTPGSGGITDLLGTGRWAGGPASFDNSAYTVTVRNTSVRLTEVVWLTGKSSPDDPALRQLASTSAGLPGSP